MKKRLKLSRLISFLFVITTLILFVLPESAHSQGPLPFDPDQSKDVPIDGGLGILAAIGGTYAIKKLREKE